MNQKNEAPLQKVDYTLPLIPIIVFAYPIVLFGIALFDWFNLSSLLIPLTFIYVSVVFMLTTTLWSIKLYLMKISYPKSKLLFKLSDFIGSLITGLIFGCLTTALFCVFSLSFLSLIELEGTVQVIWELLLGFCYVVFIKILGDLYYLPLVYNDILSKFYESFGVNRGE